MLPSGAGSRQIWPALPAKPCALAQARRFRRYRREMPGRLRRAESAKGEVSGQRHPQIGGTSAFSSSSCWPQPSAHAASRKGRAADRHSLARLSHISVSERLPIRCSRAEVAASAVRSCRSAQLPTSTATPASVTSPTCQARRASCSAWVTTGQIAGLACRKGAGQRQCKLFKRRADDLRGRRLTQFLDDLLEPLQLDANGLRQRSGRQSLSYLPLTPGFPTPLVQPVINPSRKGYAGGAKPLEIYTIRGYQAGERSMRTP
jgi:hypothetical protein